MADEANIIEENVKPAVRRVVRRADDDPQFARNVMHWLAAAADPM